MSENPKPEAVAALVKELTDVQRKVMVGGDPDSTGNFCVTRNHGTAKALVRKGLIPRPFYFGRLTALGLAVRQALTGESA